MPVAPNTKLTFLWIAISAKFTLSRQLTTTYGRGFGCQDLFHTIRFAEAWPDPEQACSPGDSLKTLG
jgi:hypothetical protein